MIITHLSGFYSIAAISIFKDWSMQAADFTGRVTQKVQSGMSPEGNIPVSVSIPVHASHGDGPKASALYIMQ